MTTTNREAAATDNIDRMVTNYTNLAMDAQIRGDITGEHACKTAASKMRWAMSATPNEIAEQITRQHSDLEAYGPRGPRGRFDMVITITETVLEALYFAYEYKTA